jgi:hypothetical protein
MLYRHQIFRFDDCRIRATVRIGGNILGTVAPEIINSQLDQREPFSFPTFANSFLKILRP